MAKQATKKRKPSHVSRHPCHFRKAAVNSLPNREGVGVGMPSGPIAGFSPNESDSADSALASAVRLAREGRTGQAILAFERALERFGPRPDILYNRAVLFQTLGRDQESIQMLRQTIDLSPRMSQAHFALGISLQNLGQYPDALRAYDRAIDIAPDHAEAHNSRGVTLQVLRDWDEARASHETAIRLKPHFADAHNSLGNAMLGLGRYDEAAAAFARVLQIDPDHRDGLNNYAVSLQRVGRIDEADVYFNKALAVSDGQSDSGAAVARCNRAIIALTKGDFEHGWPDYEYRPLRTDVKVTTVRSQPTWDGRSLPGKTVYIRAEQGCGDTIQFARYLPLVRERCGRVVFECQHDLKELFAVNGLCDEVVARRPDETHLPTPVGAEQAYLLSLPGIFKTDLSTIPWTGPYLAVPMDRVRSWAFRILASSTDRARSFPNVPIHAEGDIRLRVGIVWAGSASHSNDALRSCQFRDFAPLADIPGVQLYSFQKGTARDQLYASPQAGKVVDLSYHLIDYLDTAAALLGLDVVVTVDTSIAHVAGAVGRETWNIIANVPDWRWMLDGETTPWYPSMRLFRQNVAGDWTPVIERIAAALTEKMGKVTNGS
jgi:tetratricopeptide (TPR) repeat protein